MYKIIVICGLFFLFVHGSIRSISDANVRDEKTLKLDASNIGNTKSKQVALPQYSTSLRAHDGWIEVLQAAAPAVKTTTKCVDIPSNFSLCYGIQYTSMKLPNLLEHETLQEAIQQSEAWNSLLRLHCHPDTRLYLCSLFAPVCLSNLDKPLYPCQSMCLSVKQGCESRMAQYGFPWPEMLQCRFLVDNDMCIKPAQTDNLQNQAVCKSCAQVPTFENLMDNYCRSKIVWKARMKSSNDTHIIITKIRAFKNGAHNSGESHSVRKSTEGKKNVEHALPISTHQVNNDCTCPSLHSDHSKGGKVRNFLLMAGDSKNNTKRIGGRLPAATLIVPWRQNDKNFKRAIRRFSKVDCSTLGREIRESVLRQNHGFRPSRSHLWDD